MNQVHVKKLFAAGPSDVAEEKRLTQEVVGELNKLFDRDIQIQVIDYDLDVRPGVDDYAQNVVNKQLDIDILVVFFWLRVGTPTVSYASGSIEELEDALSKGKGVYIYFRSDTPDQMSLIDPAQLQKVNELRDNLGNRGVLYKEYRGLQSLKVLLIQHLKKEYENSITKKLATDEALLDNLGYGNIESIVDRVLNAEAEEDFDGFEFQNQILVQINQLGGAMEAITDATSGFREAMERETENLKKVNAISDDRLRLSKIKSISKLLAQSLRVYEKEISGTYPIIENSVSEIGSSYSRLLTYWGDQEVESGGNLRGVMVNFRDSIHQTTQSVASTLQTFDRWPPLDANFNNAKREMQKALALVAKALLNGLSLFNAALNEEVS